MSTTRHGKTNILLLQNICMNENYAMKIIKIDKYEIRGEHAEAAAKYIMDKRNTADFYVKCAEQRFLFNAYSLSDKIKNKAWSDAELLFGVKIVRSV